MSSAICFNLGKSKILLSFKGLGRNGFFFLNRANTYVLQEELPRGADVLQSAIEWFLFDPQARKIHLATAYQRLGWNLHKQGKNEEAVL